MERFVCSLFVLRFASAPQMSGPGRKRAGVWKGQSAVGGDKHSKRRKSLGGFSRKAPRLAAARCCEARDCVLLGEYEIFILLCFCALFAVFLCFKQQHLSSGDNYLRYAKFEISEQVLLLHFCCTSFVLNRHRCPLMKKGRKLEPPSPRPASQPPPAEDE